MRDRESGLPGILGGLAGLPIGSLLIWALGTLSRRFNEGTAGFVISQARSAMIWLTILGVVVWTTVYAARFHPMGAALAATILQVAYLPLLMGLRIPTWYPTWLRNIVLDGFGPAPFIVSGVLFGAAVGYRLTRRQATSAFG